MLFNFVQQLCLCMSWSPCIDGPSSKVHLIHQIAVSQLFQYSMTMASYSDRLKLRRYITNLCALNTEREGQYL